MSVIERTAGGQDAHDIEVRESNDQREQRRDRDDVAHHRQRHIPDALPPIGAVDGGSLVKLLRHRLQRRQIHDHKERRAVPDVDEDDGETRPVGVTGPRDRSDPEKRQCVVESAIRGIEQPQPCQRAHCRRDHPGHQQHAAPFALALGRNVVNDVGDDEANQGFKDDGGNCKDAGLPHHQPERFALEEELEVAEPDKLHHRLVQRRQMQRIERGIDHEGCDQEDQRQRHQKRRGRFALERSP